MLPWQQAKAYAGARHRIYKQLSAPITEPQSSCDSLRDFARLFAILTVASTTPFTISLRIKFDVSVGVAYTRQDETPHFRVRIQPLFCRHPDVPVEQSRPAGSTLALAAGGRDFDAVFGSGLK